MKDRLIEMKQWCDEVMREEDQEEAVSAEWAEKCLSIHFKCPCGKGCC